MRTGKAAALATIMLVLAGCTVGSGEAGVSTRAPAASEKAASLTDLGVRAVHTATNLADGTVFVAGGCVTDGCSVATASTAVVSRDGRSVQPGPQMSQPRAGHTASTLPDGRIAIIGGYPGEGADAASTVEVFDPAARTLQSLGELQAGRGGHAAAPLRDGRVLVVGGWVGSQRSSDAVESVDIDAGSTTPLPPLPWGADALEAVVLEDGRVLVTGGQVARGMGTDQAAIFDPSSATWTTVGPMTSVRFKHIGVRLDDGRVLIAGGTTDDRVLLDSTELFDPKTLTFSAGPRMTEPRYKLQGGAVALPDGRALFGGGGRSIEIVDARLGTSDRIADLGHRASFATVSLLAGEQALILGGYDDRIDLTRDALVVDIGGRSQR